MGPGAALRIPVTASRRLLFAQSLAHLVAAGAVLASTLPPWLMALLLALVGLSLARVRRPPTVAALVLGGDGGLQTVGVDGTANPVVLHPHTLVLSFLVVLLYRQDGQVRSLSLAGDSLAAEDFRQLRLWLRWRSALARPA